MNKLEKLLNELCPDGVDCKHIWEVTNWDKKFTGIDRFKQPTVIKYHYYLASDLKRMESKTGDIRILYTGSSDSGFTTEENAGDNISEGEIIAIPWGGTPRVQYYKGRFITADNRIATSSNKVILDNKFLYYWMSNNIELIKSFYRGAGIKHPSMAKVLNMSIPIPPLPVQEEIVRILDDFTELTEELTEELAKESEARRKQHVYYRDELFRFSEKVDWVKLGEFTRIFSASRVHKNEWTRSGIPFYRTSDVISIFNGVENSRGHAFISQDLYEKLSLKSGKIQKDDILITGGGTIGIPYIVPTNEALYMKDADLLCIQNSRRYNSKFLYHYFLTSKFRVYLGNITHNAAIAHYTISQIANTPVPLPPLKEQQRIVGILDHFDILVNDMTQGLPAEIEARQKQYKYYRDKLLTFKEKIS